MRREDQPNRLQRDVTQPRMKPGQTWVCGLAELGQCCRSGPTADGRCGRAVAEERGHAPQDPSANVTSDSDQNGTLPLCIPRRSLAVRRQSLRLNLAILTGGVLMLLLALPSREKTFVPGELSSKHAQILDNTLAAQRCGLCHPASHSGGDSSNADPLVAGLLSSAQRLIENDGRQDQLCMQCHQTHLPKAINRDPHDLSPEQWRELQRVSDTPWQLVSARSRLDPSTTDEGVQQALDASSPDLGKLSKTSCAMCHNEHHGRGFDIKLISDSRCQACHQRQFESLASGHPEFKNFPVDRPRGLAFSHGRHLQDHFPKKNRDFDCKSCHVSGAGAGANDLVTRSLSFEHACASCHDQPIRAATVDGWAVIQLPSIEANDVVTESAFAKWPASARFGYDGLVSPVLRALLMADPEAVSVLEKLPASGKIVDISTISSTRASVAKALASATQRLIEETARDGQAAWIARLQKVTRTHLERELNEQDQALIAAMAAGVPPDLFRHVEAQWWHDPQSLVQSTSVPARLTSQATPPPSQSKSSTDDSLLNGAGSNDDLLTPTEDPDQLLLGSSGSVESKPTQRVVKGATHLTGGGWYADSSTMSIRYMPTGHADATLAAWSLWWSMLESRKPFLPTGNAERITQRLNLTTAASATDLDQRIADSVPGKCTECHQLDKNSLPTQLVGLTSTFRLADHYQVPERNPNVREFTKFRHTAHLTLPALSDCRYCHQDKQQQADHGIKTYVKHHPASSEFSTMTVSQCSACHRSGGANDRCVQCHNYHVTTP